MPSTRRARISAQLATADIAGDFGPAARLDTETRAWRRETLAGTFRSYRDEWIAGVGATHTEALRDAEDEGRISLDRYDGDLNAAVSACAKSAAWTWKVTPAGVALLHARAV
ncbi:hypothetical protein [Streptomyces sp. CC224B]|uniref:hypothetical protein n=1 Tax=Streptomyces sp. CC224B TaxID=3044571 RepID=UPI0024A8896A|nr:hypothetical protein [Streptomyces sp. CC224B]